MDIHGNIIVAWPANKRNCLIKA